MEAEIKNQQAEFSRLQEEKEKLLKQIFQAEENSVDINEVVEKAGHFDLLIRYIVIESEGYLEKSPLKPSEKELNIGLKNREAEKSGYEEYGQTSQLQKGVS